MAAPVLTNYQYQFGDSGILLNGGATLPFIDVHNVEGLSAMPEIETKLGNFDGRHGGVSSAQFFSARTVVIDGTVYADPNNIGAVVDQLNLNFAPTNLNTPFYFKEPGNNQRYIMCKSFGIKLDHSNLRALGSSPIQIQLFAGDPFKYENLAPISMSHNVPIAVVNNGNALMSPQLTIIGNFASMIISRELPAPAVSMSLVKSGGANSDQTVVDFNTRRVMLNGFDTTSMVDTFNWWGIEPQSSASIQYSVTSPSPDPINVVANLRHKFM